MREAFDVLIIGAGAAGCYCAIHAAERGLRVALIEKNPSIGAKIRVSGGGRCNLTNQEISAEHYLSENPDFCRSALHRHNQWQALAWFEAAGLHFEEKTLGQLFCVQRSRGVIASLQQALDRLGVTLITDARIQSLRAENDGYQLQSNQGDWLGRQCVIATGGPAWPKLGASAFALQIARQFHLPVLPFRPALVPLTLKQPLTALSGLSCEVIVSCAGSPSFRENLLFTHHGLSGPAILQISSYWRAGEAITVNFLPDEPADALYRAKQQTPQISAQQWLKQRLPKTLAQYLIPNERPLQEYSHDALQALSGQLFARLIYPNGDEGLKKAEVCRGGVDTRCIDPRHFSVRSQTGLYFIGEALDVTGWLGGYNFQWAWSSAWCCAQALQ